jgi:hypothetical protein
MNLCNKIKVGIDLGIMALPVFKQEALNTSIHIKLDEK